MAAETRSAHTIGIIIIYMAAETRSAHNSNYYNNIYGN